MIYYVDNISGAATNDGLTPETAVISYKNVNIASGDAVLFCRGWNLTKKPARNRGWKKYFT